MRIAILQFSPRLGEPEWNISRADAILAEAGYPDEASERNGDRFIKRRLDLMVLPELAFSGYNFASLSHIRPFLEYTAAGRSAAWAARIARRLRCLVAIGYPEKTYDPTFVPRVVTDKAQSSEGEKNGQGQFGLDNFNSLLIVDPIGNVVAHYRKTHLYYTDATWSQPSTEGWTVADLPFLLEPRTVSCSTFAQIRTSFAICMDLNPQYFTAPWTAYEAASFASSHDVDLLLCSMAWLSSREDLAPEEPDMQTITYWIERLTPLLQKVSHETTNQIGSARNIIGLAGNETLVIVANRAGIEPGPTRACELDPMVREADKMSGESVFLAEERLPSLVVGNVPTDTFAQACDHNSKQVVGKIETENGNNSCNGTTLTDSLNEDQSQSVLGPIMSHQAQYAGSSVVMALGQERVKIWGTMGIATEGLMVIDTSEAPASVYAFKQRDEAKPQRPEEEKTDAESHR